MKNEWIYEKLDDVCSVDYGTRVVQKKDKGSKYYVYGGGGATFMVDTYNREDCFVVARFAMSPKCTRFVSGKFFLNDSGLSVSTKSTKLLQSFVNKVLLANNDTIYNMGKGMAQKNLDMPSFRNLDIPVPPLQEQERIVAELDLLTGIIDKQKQQLKELDNLAQSIFYDMFGSVDNNTKNFMVKCLNEVFQLITDGTHQTPQYTDDILHGFKFLSAKDVVSGVIDWTRIKYIPESLHNELYKRLAPRRGDILLCKNGTTGICALVETDEVFDIYVSLALLRTEKEYNKKYLVYAINNPSTKSQFDDSLKGVGVPNLHLGEIKNTKILVPPIELQSSFAKKIESIESQKEFINRSLAESQKLFDYTMDKYFG